MCFLNSLRLFDAVANAEMTTAACRTYEIFTSSPCTKTIYHHVVASKPDFYNMH